MKKGSRWILVVLGLMLLCLIIYGGRSAYLLMSHAKAASAAAGRLQALLDQTTSASEAPLTADTVIALKGELAQIETELRAMQRDGGWILGVASRLGGLPGYGANFAAAPIMLDISINLASAANLSLELADPVIFAHFEERAPEAGHPSVIAQAISVLEQHPEQVAQFADAVAHAVKSRQALQEVAGTSEAPITLAPPLQEMVNQIDAILPGLWAVSRLLPFVPELLGAHGSCVYLLLAQNNEELRPTGGFISGVGELVLMNGELISLQFMDSYAVDDLTKPHPAPPPALAYYMQADYLVLRDANWSPDFPTTAQVVASLYQLDRGISVQGVIATDLTILERLLEATGPLSIEGYAETVTAKNYMELLMRYWSAPAAGLAVGEKEWWLHRKDFAGAVLEAALQRMLESPEEIHWVKLFANLARALEEKHVLLFLYHDKAMAILKEAGWDGAMRPTAGDYLAVIDTNVGFNKVNALIEEHITYHVWLDGQPRAELRVHYRHKGTQRLSQCIHEARYGENYADMRQRCYWDYVRIYLPAGSVVREISGFDAGTVEPVFLEGDKSVVSGLFVLAPGDERDVRLTYELPSGVYAGGIYQIDVQKQAGTEAVRLEIVVEDAGCQAGLQSSTAGTERMGLGLRFVSDLRVDRRLDIRCP